MIRVAFRWLMVLVVCLACATVEAQRIYVLAVGDTSEKSGLSFSTGPDLQYIFDAFYVNVPGGQLVTYNNPMADFADGSSANLQNPWEGPDVRGDLADMKNKILRAIDRCPAGPNDTIVVFYTGHGASDDEGHFLVMPDGKTWLHRKTILERMARKRPRLAVLLTDSCNLQIPSGMAPGPSARLIPPARISPLFETLFIRSRGVVDINSSSEGEVSVGAIGGGLLTLSLAYMGNQPNFKSYPGFKRPPGSTVDRTNDAVIPSVDHSMAMAEFFGRMSEHGMHGNFDPDQPPFGIWFAYQDQRLNWEAVRELLTKKIQTLFTAAAPKGWDTGQSKQMTQTPRFYSLPTTEGGTSRVMPLTQPGRPQPGPPQTGNQGFGQGPGPVRGPAPPPRRWSRPTYRPEVGDRIMEVNGQAIHNMNDYIRAVKNSPATMTFVLWEPRTGKSYLMRTQLNPPNADSRFGVGARNAQGDGVRVEFLMRGYPGTRCQVAQ
ncbi:MAG: caspase family protein [Pirellulales bacterium]|nr:caspase family protein [Pirellulales bacterium]